MQKIIKVSIYMVFMAISATGCNNAIPIITGNESSTSQDVKMRFVAGSATADNGAEKITATLDAKVAIGTASNGTQQIRAQIITK